MNNKYLKSKYEKALRQDMVFKDIPTAMDFLQDMGNVLPDMFEFSPPKNPDEHIRATEGGQTIILMKNKTLKIEDEILPVFICQEFCTRFGKYTVWDIVDSNLRYKI